MSIIDDRVILYLKRNINKLADLSFSGKVSCPIEEVEQFIDTLFWATYSEREKVVDAYHREYITPLYKQYKIFIGEYFLRTLIYTCQHFKNYKQVLPYLEAYDYVKEKVIDLPKVIKNEDS